MDASELLTDAGRATRERTRGARAVVADLEPITAALDAARSR